MFLYWLFQCSPACRKVCHALTSDQWKKAYIFLAEIYVKLSLRTHINSEFFCYACHDNPVTYFLAAMLAAIPTNCKFLLHDYLQNMDSFPSPQQPCLMLKHLISHRTFILPFHVCFIRKTRCTSDSSENSCIFNLPVSKNHTGEISDKIFRYSNKKKPKKQIT